MRKKTKSLAYLLIAVLVLSAFPAPAVFADGRVDGYGQTVVAGTRNSFEIDDWGSLWGWGANNYGQIGDGFSTDLQLWPTYVRDNARAISIMWSHAMLIDQWGTLWGWGNGARGRLGVGTEVNHSSPVLIMSDVAFVSAGGGHTAAIDIWGNLWTWGANGAGQLGDGTTTDRHFPTWVMSGVMAVSAGDAHTMALTYSGELWAFGSNESGRLGDGTTISRSAPVIVANNIAAVSAGWTHTLAIDAWGDLFAWGNNSHGQLGLGDFYDRHQPTFVTSVWNGFAAVSAGAAHSLAIDYFGDLYGWGNNNNGQLLLGSFPETPYVTYIRTDVAGISAGYLHTSIVTSHGEHLTWGNNEWGQLGNNTSQPHIGAVHVGSNVWVPGWGANIPDPPDASPYMNWWFASWQEAFYSALTYHWAFDAFYLFDTDMADAPILLFRDSWGDIRTLEFWDGELWWFDFDWFYGWDRLMDIMNGPNLLFASSQNDIWSVFENRGAVGNQAISAQVFIGFDRINIAAIQIGNNRYVSIFDLERALRNTPHQFWLTMPTSGTLNILTEEPEAYRSAEILDVFSIQVNGRTENIFFENVGWEVYVDINDLTRFIDLDVSWHEGRQSLTIEVVASDETDATAVAEEAEGNFFSDNLTLIIIVGASVLGAGLAVVIIIIVARSAKKKKAAAVAQAPVQPVVAPLPATQADYSQYAPPQAAAQAEQDALPPQPNVVREEASGTAFCPNCGNPHSGNVKFCGSCGSSLS